MNHQERGPHQRDHVYRSKARDIKLVRLIQQLVTCFRRYPDALPGNVRFTDGSTHFFLILLENPTYKSGDEAGIALM